MKPVNLIGSLLITLTTFSALGSSPSMLIEDDTKIFAVKTDLLPQAEVFESQNISALRDLEIILERANQFYKYQVIGSFHRKLPPIHGITSLR